MRGGRRFLPMLALVPALSLVLAAGCADPAAPPSRKLEPASLTARIDDLLRLNPAHDQLRAVVVLHRGRLVYEHYEHSSAGEYWNTDAVTTSVLATLIGIAVHDGRIPGLGARLDQLLPAHASRMPPGVARTTLRQLLTMTGGFDVPANNRADLFTTERDPVGKILASPANAPGRFFDYSDEGAHLLSAILQRATGMSVLSYARAKLFDPLGLTTRPAQTALGTARALAAGSHEFGWAVDRAGTQYGWNGLRLRPRDLARLGQLYLDGGRWHGRQLVPENWAYLSTLTQVSTGYEVAPAYGYGWWVDQGNGRSAYFAWGYGGQLLEVLPQQQMVVAIATEQDPTNLVRGFFAAELTFLVDYAIVPAVAQAGA